MLSSQQLLEIAAQDGSIDIAEWARVLEYTLQKLHDIVHSGFPVPPVPLPTLAPAPSNDEPEAVASTPPQIPTSESAPTEHDLPDAESERFVNSQSSTKENDAPTDIAGGSLPATSHSGYSGYELSKSQQSDGMLPPQASSASAPDGSLPPELLSSYQMSRRILERDFAASPPYTIQRLAELVLHPKRHYRFLPAYLRALDRVVSVSSPVSDFPLPTLQSPLNGDFLTNGQPQVNGITERGGLGSDESLGGALLTPIPWLRNQNANMLSLAPVPGTDGEIHSESTETIEGPHGAGSIETVSVTFNGIPSTTSQLQQQQPPSSSPITSPTLSEQSDASTGSASSTEAQLREQGAVTQGELLRQEQEAGVVPVHSTGQPMTPRRTLMAGGAAAVGRDGSGAAAAPTLVLADVDDDEQPHARGPDVIGMEDMGPQPTPSADGSAGLTLDMEAAVGRGRSKSPQPPPAAAAATEPTEPSSAPTTTSTADDVQMEDAEQQQQPAEPGQPGQAPRDVPQLVDVIKDERDREMEARVRDADGDVEIMDADGNPTTSTTSTATTTTISSTSAAAAAAAATSGAETERTRSGTSSGGRGDGEGGGGGVS